MGFINYLQNRFFYALIYACVFISPIIFYIPGTFAEISLKNQAYENGLKAFEKGDFGEAIYQWEMAEKYCKAHENTEQQIEILIRTANAYQYLGRPVEAIKILNRAAELADNAGNNLIRGKIMLSMGQAYQSLGQSDIAAGYLKAALRIAGKENDKKTVAAVLNNLGNLYFTGFGKNNLGNLYFAGFGKNDYEKAGQYYEKSIKTANDINDMALAIGPEINLARLEIENENFKKSVRLLEKSLQYTMTMEPGHKKAYFLIAIGRLFSRIPYGDLAKSLKLFDKAAQVAEKIKDDTALSYAFGEKGALYEKLGDYEKALEITRKAVFVAQRSNSTKSLYKWQWQTGRILKKTGDTDGAISSYRLAIYSLEAIRQNLSFGCKKGNCMSFKQVINPLYFDMADLLLRRSAINGRAYEKYAIVTVPGLTLTDPRPLRRKNMKLLLNGLTKPVQGFSPLPNVSSELKKVKELYKAKVLKDQDFTISKIETQLEKTPYSVVHIASHGQFDRDLNNTFLLAYDGKLTMDILEKVMNISKFRDEPVELLTLSACQTALGDDRAALGLAGVALKAGARSAIATLWFIDDKTTSELISEFYKQLQNPGLSKAQALKQAQIKMINDPASSHPAYWAPFLLIGNWM